MRVFKQLALIWALACWNAASKAAEPFVWMEGDQPIRESGSVVVHVGTLTRRSSAGMRRAVPRFKAQDPSPA